METISDEQKRKEALAAIRRLADFPDLARFVLYQRAFAEEFPRFAPAPMSELVSFASVGVKWGSADLGSSERMNNRIEMMELVTNWCAKWNLDVPWVWKAATLTVVTASFNQLRGLPAPESLVLSISPTTQEVDGKLWSTIEEVDIRPIAGIDIHVRPNAYTWDPLQETRAQFRDRAKQEFLARLDEELALTAEVADITPVDVKYQWVQWLILKRVLKRSISSIARDYRKTEDKDIRRTVRDGISMAQEILFVKLPDGESGD